MAKVGKKYEAAKKQIEARPYTLDDAMGALKKVHFAKFNETVEVHMRLGVDPKHADQMVRGTVVLPHGLGKSKKVLVIATGEKVKEAEKALEDPNFYLTDGKMTLVIAIAYGGRWDLASAARRLAERVVAGELRAEDIDEAQLGEQLALAGLPDPDLLIRTGGEQRISNFLLWNLAYTELYFCDTLWPDFDESELDAAIAHFGRRQRRFGLVPEQVGTR